MYSFTLVGVQPHPEHHDHVIVAEFGTVDAHGFKSLFQNAVGQGRRTHLFLLEMEELRFSEEAIETILRPAIQWWVQDTDAHKPHSPDYMFASTSQHLVDRLKQIAGEESMQATQQDRASVATE